MNLERRAGLYVHVPFCRRKCGYCSFFSFAPQPGDLERFMSALRLQMRQMIELPAVRELTFATVFFGGGTPSILPPSILAQLLAELRLFFPLHADEPEITVEVNPGTIDAAGLLELRRAGFNRLSIGVQSLDDQELAGLGRIHSSDEALATIGAARRAGFDNLSFDLMYGLPGQTLASWRTTLDRAMALDPVHLSMYELTVEPETPFADQAQTGAWALPPEEEVMAMMAAIDVAIADRPLQRYEISNYAVPGRESRHNCNYWENGQYVGLGPGAVSAMGGTRRSAVADLAEYCRLAEAGLSVWGDEERLDQEAAFRETVVMGLRLLAGVSVSRLRQRFGLDLAAYYGTTLDRLIGQGLLILQEDHLRLSSQGLPLANRVMAELV